MSHKDWIRTFAQDTTRCLLCATLLPEHKTWPGKRTHTCDALSCVDDFDRLSESLGKLAPGAVLVRAGEEVCHGPKCGRPLPAGIYASRSKAHCCCSECWYRRNMNRTLMYVCTCGCGKMFGGNRSMSRRRGSAFYSHEHRRVFLLEENLRRCGALASVAREYLTTFVPVHYRSARNPKGTIFPFFSWCSQSGIAELAQIRPSDITRYLAWCKLSGKKTPSYRVSGLSTFFAWAIAEERYPFANPVVNRIHGQRYSNPAPRPLSEAELAMMWRHLEEKNDPQLLFAASIAEESGLRIGEVCNLRLGDIDVAGQQVFVRLPNKSNKERYSLFGTRTAQYFHRLLAVRPKDLEHDNLLWNAINAPMRAHSLHRFFQLALCKAHKGKVTRETGFDRWSTHRLRHTMATGMRRGGADVAALMAIGGWQSMDAAGAYIEVTAADSKREYDAAMERVRKAAANQNVVETETLTPLQLLERLSKPAETKHCV